MKLNINGWIETVQLDMVSTYQLYLIHSEFKLPDK